MRRYKENKYKRILAGLLLSTLLFENCIQPNIQPTKLVQEKEKEQDGGVKVISTDKLQVDNDREDGTINHMKRVITNIDLATLTTEQGFVIQGSTQHEMLGSSVSGAGDINGDGVSDLIIGAAENTYNKDGVGYVIYGNKAITRPNLDLSTLSSSEGFSIRANGTTYGLVGYSVSTAGDVNGDGVTDLIIGAPTTDALGRLDAGTSYVVYGKPISTRPNINLSTLSITDGFAIHGGAISDQSGFIVSNAGDVNGDGIDDLIIGTYLASPLGRTAAGASYVIYGKLGNTRSSLDLGRLATGDGFAIQGAAPNDNSGFSVSTAGDVNKDGLSDVIIGAPSASPLGKASAGTSYVIYGKPGSTRLNINLASLPIVDGFAIQGVAPGDNTGWSGSNAGDVNGDGISDVIIGAVAADPFLDRPDAGASYVLYGKNSTRPSVDLANLLATDGFVIQGAVSNDVSGISVSTAGDINGDGLSDLIVGSSASPLGKHNAGTSYVIYGKPSSTRGNIDLDTLRTSDGFVVQGAAPGEMSGRIVSDAGDVNGDGVSDLIIGAYRATVPNKQYAGVSYVIYGINGVPVITQNALAIKGGKTVTLSASNIQAIDLDNTDQQLKFQVIDLQNGIFTRLGSTIREFNKANITGGFIKFTSTSCINAPFYKLTASDLTHTTSPSKADITFESSVCRRDQEDERFEPAAATNSAGKVETPWYYSPARWMKAISSYLQGEVSVTNTPESEGLLKLHARCSRMIEEANAKTADKWYRFSLEDLQEEMAAMLNQPEEVTEETVKEFRDRLASIDKDFLRAPLLEKPSFFSGIQDKVEIKGLYINQEGNLLQSSVMPMLGLGHVAPAIGK